MSQTPFDDLTDVYEAMIDWPKRLGVEGPFFRRIFERFEVKRVADLACGTGRHAAMFHSWGLEVEASDLSPNMIARARERFGESDGLHWVVRGFEQPPERSGSFDAVTCIGNSLALAGDLAAAEQALHNMFDTTRSGGVVITQVLNLSKFPPGPCVWQKATRMKDARGPLILKGIHRCQNDGYADLVVVDADAQPPSIRSHSVRFLGLQAEHLEAIARSCGAAPVTFFGSHREDAYSAAESADLIMVAQKAR